MKVEVIADGPWAGYRVYKIWHKRQGRWYAVLYRDRSDRTTIQWAKFVLSNALGRRLSREETVDHIDGDRTNDELNNLQILTLAENARKSARPKTWIGLCCATCGELFLRERRQVKTGGSYCSRACQHAGLRNSETASRQAHTL